MRLYLKSRCWSPRKSRIFLAALLFFFCLSFPAHDRPMAQEAKKILVIYSYHPVFPWTSLWRTGFEEELQKQISRLEIGVQVFDEYMDSVRFKNNESYFKTYLQSKYQNRNLDLILAVDMAAASFVADYQHELFPNLPLLIFTDEPWLHNHQIPEKASLVLSNKVSIETNIELILKLHPRTRKIVFVTGTSSESQERKEVARQVIRDYQDRLGIHFMDDLELEEMLKQISSLPKDAVILYDIFARDSAGRWYVPAKVLEKMARVSSVPIYGLWDSLLGHGMVGGYLVSAELSGKATAQTAVKMLTGNILPQGIMADQKLVSYMFDHGQLKRWGIDDRDLPPGSVVKFRSPTLWEQYLWEIMGLLLLLGLESLLVIYLFTTRAHLKRAQRSLKKAHAELEERVAERTCELQNMNQQLEETLAKVKTLVKELECRNEELNLLGEMGGLLQSSQTNEEAFGVVTRYVQLLFPSESGGVFIFRSSRNALEAVATWGQAHSSQEIFPPGNCWALKRGKVHMVRGGDLKIACQHVEVSLLAGSGYMCVPLIAQGEVLGLLYLQQPAAPDTKGDNWESISKPIERLTTTMAEQISLAIANIQLRERLRDQAIRDPLTNLFNRRYMEETLEREIGRVSRKKLPLGIIMLDIDHFKRLNDKYGHDAGDTVLREISIFLHSHLRKEDIACRYGGEEFILILPGAELNITLGRAEELQQGIQRLNIESHGQVLGVLTISLGVVVFPDHGSDMDMLLQAVDEALYRAKAEGRNCVIVGKRIDA